MPGNVFPTQDLAFIQFCEQRSLVWSTDALAIGLTVAIGNEFKTLTADARAAFNASETAKQAAKAATANSRLAIKALRTAGGNDVKSIRAFAERQSKPQEVYNLAQIPAPSPRTPSIPPIAPSEISARLDTETGGLTVRWKVAQPKGLTGVVYRVERNTGSGQAWDLVGLVGGKTFEDTSVPTTQTVRYRVIAQRGNLASNPSQTLEVTFGNGGPGARAAFTLNAGESAPVASPKLAA